ncbi:MAG: Uncharacterized protein XU12_C0005G0042 [Deltaproteobacteria bacterium CSP1-8]|nr:MAG: Uncharacterized protein XU12_C0005G0042 [Deltaproteobacteria bacterium CSP1-8]
MRDRESVVRMIRDAFGRNEYPGDPFLQGSFDGCEPFEEVGVFRGKADWISLEAEFLDAHADALSFFSQAGFRFFLPAYLVADLFDRLQTADPLFHLTHGFSDSSVEVPAKGRTFLRKLGKSVFVNPRRYGATTYHDYARYRLSSFPREEAAAIVNYLEYKREGASTAFEGDAIEEALRSFWRERAQTAPSAESLARHLAEEAEYFDAIRDRKGEGGPPEER